MRVTAILGKSGRGYRWVVDEDAPLRIETCQSHTGDAAEVQRKLIAELNRYKDGQTQITVGIDPDADDPLPGKDYDSGDRATVDGATRDIESFAFSVDDSTGRVTAVPQFGDLLDEPAARIARTARNIGGLNGGTSRTARPVASLQQPNIKP